MSGNESLNFYKFSTLLLDVVRDVLCKRIQHECINNSVSFEDFLNRIANKDTLLHLWKSVRCCNAHCNISRTRTTLTNVQWNNLYTSSGTVGHVKRDQHGRICQECTCNYKARSGIVADSLDLTLASCILLDLCTLTQAEKDSIKTLRGFRNSDFAHVREAKISDSDFNQYWRKIENEITSLSTSLDSSTKRLITEKLDHLQNTPFVDNETLQTLVNKILLQQNQDNCIIEKMEEIAEEQSDNTPQRKVQKITDAEAEISDFIPTKGLEKGTTSIKTHGIAIFTGVCGCGKSTNSIEILRRVKTGEIFQEAHSIQHINIDHWDLQVDIDQNTVVFLEDPLGTTNANTALTEHDNGTFRKIWTCIQKGKVKVLMTVRSNILYQCKHFLQRHDIFDDKCVINLSEGDCALDEQEKRQIVQLYCNKYNVSIQQDKVQKVDDISLHVGSSIPLKINDSTIKEIVKSDPQIGFPLCCRMFFENPKNISVGARYFLQPSKMLLNEIKNLAVSENKTETLQFAILIYMLMNNGRIDVNKIEHETFEEIVKGLGLSGITDFHIRISVDNLNDRFLCSCCESESTYEFLHTTILESVFIIATEKVQILISALLSKANIKIICELVRTEGIVGKENEVIVKIKKNDYKFIAERFVREVREKNFAQIIAHSSMSDNSFSPVLFDKLKEYPEIFNEQNQYGYTLFQIACLYEKADLVKGLINNGLIPSGILREGIMMCIEFDNIHTFENIIQNIPEHPEHLREAFRCSCKKGKRKMVQSVITLANEDLLPDHLRQGFELACAYGDVNLVKDILKCDIENGFQRGLEEACKKGHIQIVKYLLKENIDLTDEQLGTCFVSACQHGYVDIGIFILSFLPPVLVTKALIGVLRCCDRKIAMSLLKNKNTFSDDCIRQCLLTICDNKNDYITKPSFNYDFTNSVSGESCTPFPMSIQTKSSSVPIYTPATGNVNLFPQIKYKTSDVETQNRVSRNQIKALMMKSMLESRQNFPIEYIEEVVINASKKGSTEILSVLFSAMDNSKPSKTIIAKSVEQTVENGHVETMQFILSEKGDQLSDFRDVLYSVCKQDNVTCLQNICDTLQIPVKDNEEVLQIACGNESLKIINYILDLSPEMPLEAILDTWNEISRNFLVQSAKVLLNRKDIPHEHIKASLYQACDMDHIEFIGHVLPQSHEFPHEIAAFAKYAYQQKHFDVFHLIINENTKILLPDILPILSDIIDADDFKTFKIMLHAYSSILIQDIGQLITENFKTKYYTSILECLLDVHSDMTSEEIEAMLFEGYNNLLHLQKIQTLLTTAVINNNTTDIKAILKDNTKLSSTVLVSALTTACRYKVCNFKILMELSSKQLGINELFSVFIETCKYGKLKHVEIILNYCSNLSDEQICEGLVQICSKTEIKRIARYQSRETHQYNAKIVKCILSKRQNLSSYQISRIVLAALEKKSLVFCIVVIENGNTSASDIANILPHLNSRQLASAALNSDALPLQSTLQARKEQITECIYQCLVDSISTLYRTPCKSDIETMVQLVPLPLSTDQIYQCLLSLCKRYDPDKSIIEMFIQLLPSPLTTDQIHQRLLPLCTQYKPDKSIQMFIQLLPSPLTTDQIHQCLLPLCTRGTPDKSVIEMFIQLLPSPLTTDQIHQCLLPLCERVRPDKSILEMFVQLLPSPLVTDQIHQCLLTLCEEDIPDNSIIEMFVQLLPSPLTTYQIHQCLLTLLSSDYPDKSSVEMFLQKGRYLTTDQIYECLIKYVKRLIHYAPYNPNPIIIETMLTQRPDLTTEMVIHSVLTLLENVDFDHFNECCDTIDIILKIRTELTLEEIKTLYDAFCKSFRLGKFSDRITTLTITITRRRPDFVSHINDS